MYVYTYIYIYIGEEGGEDLGEVEGDPREGGVELPRAIEYTPSSHSKNSLSKILSMGWVAQKPCLIGSLKAALRFSKSRIRKDTNLGLRTGCSITLCHGIVHARLPKIHVYIYYVHVHVHVHTSVYVYVYVDVYIYIYIERERDVSSCLMTLSSSARSYSYHYS